MTVQIWEPLQDGISHKVKAVEQLFMRGLETFVNSTDIAQILYNIMDFLKAGNKCLKS